MANPPRNPRPFLFFYVIRLLYGVVTFAILCTIAQQVFHYGLVLLPWLILLSAIGAIKLAEQDQAAEAMSRRWEGTMLDLHQRTKDTFGDADDFKPPKAPTMPPGWGVDKTPPDEYKDRLYYGVPIPQREADQADDERNEAIRSVDTDESVDLFTTRMLQRQRANMEAAYENGSQHTAPMPGSSRPLTGRDITDLNLTTASLRLAAKRQSQRRVHR